MYERQLGLRRLSARPGLPGRRAQRRRASVRAPAYSTLHYTTLPYP